MVATDFSLRHCGLPALDLWQAVLPNQKVLCVHEDNQAMIRIIETGKNPTMRYLHRTHRISVAWLHEVFGGKDLNLEPRIHIHMVDGPMDQINWGPRTL